MWGGADGGRLADPSRGLCRQYRRDDAAGANIEKVLARYPIKRVVLVADRGLLSLDNLEAIRALRVGDQPLEFILAVPARRYGDFDRLLTPFHEKSCRPATAEVFGELKLGGVSSDRCPSLR
ncbi:MAG: hypothetical protein V5B34_11535 [Accumulibacter sp.]